MRRVLTFSVATLLLAPSCTGQVQNESSPVSQESAPESSPDSAEVVPTPVPDSPDPADAQAECDAKERAINAKVAALPRACAKDGDCYLDSFGCPFGCSEVLALSDKESPALAEVESMVEDYYAVCAACEYKCAKPPLPLCREGVCVGG